MKKQESLSISKTSTGQNKNQHVTVGDHNYRDISHIEKPICFVIMPFSHVPAKAGHYNELNKPELDTVFSMFKGTFERLGYQVRRSDSPGAVLRDLVIDLDRAALTVADLTGLNPNVMYELGIRHGFARPTILLTQDDLNYLPFDLKGYFAIRYQWVTDTDKSNFEGEVQRIMRTIAEKTDVRFGPVDTFLEAKSAAFSDLAIKIAYQRLNALAAEFNTIGAIIKPLLDSLPKRYPKLVMEYEKHIAVLDENEARITPFAEGKKILDSLPDNLPALDLLLAEYYLPIECGAEGEVMGFILVAGEFKFFWTLPDDSIAYFARIAQLTAIIVHDIERLLTALRMRNTGRELGLLSKKFANDTSLTSAFPNENLLERRSKEEVKPLKKRTRNKKVNRA